MNKMVETIKEESNQMIQYGQNCQTEVDKITEKVEGMRQKSLQNQGKVENFMKTSKSQIKILNQMVFLLSLI